MPLSFFVDQSKARSDLTQVVKLRSHGATILTTEGATSWNGALPSRVGDDFYAAPWLIYSSITTVPPVTELSVFSADQVKNPQETAVTLAKVASATDWAIFPWGGYARYGMLGLIADGYLTTQVASKPIFRYPTAENFEHNYRALIARRTRSAFAPFLWQAICREIVPPLIVTFEYYKEAFEPASLRFHVEGTFVEREGGSRLSVYRALDYATFEYFVGMSNQVSIFDILPGSLSLDSCAKVRRMADDLDFAGALQHTPWLLVYNGGEIDTNHLLFAASEHDFASQFAAKAASTLDVACYF